MKKHEEKILSVQPLDYKRSIMNLAKFQVNIAFYLETEH